MFALLMPCFHRDLRADIRAAEPGQMPELLFVAVGVISLEDQCSRAVTGPPEIASIPKGEE